MRFCITKCALYKRSVSGPYLTYINGDNFDTILREFYEGLCENYFAGRAFAFKVKQQGYFWPTMVADCEKYSLRCKKYQRHAPLIHQCFELLSSVSDPYPFMRWLMDIVGHLHPSTGNVKYLLVLTNYFSKWIEAGAYKNMTDTVVQRFVSRNIICCHGLPYIIITDNGSQFISKNFEGLCETWKIRLSKSTS